MGLEDDLLTCLALERQAYALYGRWAAMACADGALCELLGRLADQSDRHRASLWDLCVTHAVAPPPSFELVPAPATPPVEHAKATLRRAIAELTRLAAHLAPFERGLVERVRNEDAAQLRQLLILAPESARALAAGREPTLQSSEPRWRPGIE